MNEEEKWLDKQWRENELAESNSLERVKSVAYGVVLLAGIAAVLITVIIIGLT